MSTSHNVFCSRMLYFRGHLGQEGLSGKPLLAKSACPLTYYQFLPLTSLKIVFTFLFICVRKFSCPQNLEIIFFPLAHSVPLT